MTGVRKTQTAETHLLPTVLKLLEQQVFVLEFAHKLQTVKTQQCPNWDILY